MKQRVNEYEAMQKTIQEGVAYGLSHWYKHRDDTPGDLESMAEFVADRVMNEIADGWEFEDDGDSDGN